MLVVPNHAQRLAENVMCVNVKIILPNSVPKRETLVNIEHGQQKIKFVNEIDENVVLDNNDYVFMVDGHVAKPPKFNVQFDECSVTMIADSGASCSIIDEKTFKCKFNHTKLEKCCADMLNAYIYMAVLAFLLLAILQLRSSVVNKQLMTNSML